MDDYLSYFELLSEFLDLGVLDFKSIDSIFGHYIARAYENPEIKAYIKRLRKDYQDNEYYTGFEELALKILEEEQKRHLRDRERNSI